MTFKQYLATRPITDDIEGDFVTDARRDKTFPDAKNFDEIERYIRRKARDEAHVVVEAAQSLWTEFESK